MMKHRISNILAIFVHRFLRRDCWNSSLL